MALGLFYSATLLVLTPYLLFLLSEQGSHYLFLASSQRFLHKLFHKRALEYFLYHNNSCSRHSILFLFLYPVSAQYRHVALHSPFPRHIPPPQAFAFRHVRVSHTASRSFLNHPAYSYIHQRLLGLCHIYHFVLPPLQEASFLPLPLQHSPRRSWCEAQKNISHFYSFQAPPS